MMFGKLVKSRILFMLLNILMRQIIYNLWSFWKYLDCITSCIKPFLPQSPQGQVVCNAFPADPMT